MFKEYEINGLVAGIGESEFMKQFITNLTVKTILGKLRQNKWAIGKYFKEIVCKSEDWINLAEVDSTRAFFVNAVMDIAVA